MYYYYYLNGHKLKCKILVGVINVAKERDGRVCSVAVSRIKNEVAM